MAPSERELSAKLTEGEIFAKTPTARFAIAQHGTAVNPSRAGAFRTCSYGYTIVGRYARYVRTGGRWLFAESKAGRCREVF